MKTQQSILTITYHHPTENSGIISDLKTFEAHHLHGLSVCSAVVAHKEIDYNNCHWSSSEIIRQQIALVFSEYEINTVKIETLQNPEIIWLVIKRLKQINAKIKIILNLVSKKNLPFNYNTKTEQQLLEKILQNCSLMVVDHDDLKTWISDEQIEETIAYYSEHTNIFLSQRNKTSKEGWDKLYHSKIVMVNIPPGKKTNAHKPHKNSIISSSIACNIALGIALEDAVKNAKLYVENLLNPK